VRAGEICRAEQQASAWSQVNCAERQEESKGCCHCYQLGMSGLYIGLAYIIHSYSEGFNLFTRWRLISIGMHVRTLPYQKWTPPLFSKIKCLKFKNPYLNTFLGNLHDLFFVLFIWSARMYDITLEVIKQANCPHCWKTCSE